MYRLVATSLYKYLIEFIGTFVFLTVILATGKAIPIGLALAAMIYWGGPVSGGCFNPAVSLVSYLNNSLSMTDMVIYIVLQLLAAACAYAFFKQTKGLYKTSQV